MIRELAAYVHAHGFSVEIDGQKLIIRKDGYCYSWSLVPYRGASYIHQDILLNEADMQIQYMQDLMNDGPQDPSTHGQSVWELWRKKTRIGLAIKEP
jgi:hypothetical protein